MPGPAGAVDDALEQALQAQLTPHAHLDGWRCRYGPVAGADAPASVNTVAVAPSAAPEETDGASRGTGQTRAGAISAATADGAAQTTEPRRGARPKPVPPPRSGEHGKAALDAARQRNAELKALRTGLQARQLTLAELLAQAQSGHAAGRMLVRTTLMALPGIRTAIASQLMIQAGIGDGCRAGALSATQRELLVSAVGAVRRKAMRIR
jgi:S13-like H2TH domain